MRNFFAYSLPGSNEIICGGSQNLYRGLHENSFIIAPFDQSSCPCFAIPFDKVFDFRDLNDMLRKAEANVSYFKFPDTPTDKSYHTQKIKEIIKYLKGNPDHKIVAARIILGDEKIDFEETFRNIRKVRKDSFTFIFYTPETGCWFGASPELLVEAKNDTLQTVALAGTRPVDACLRDWSSKNIEEQNIVKEYILNILEKNDIIASYGNLKTRNAGNIEHLITVIQAVIPTSWNSENLKRLLCELSPTPALCGYPKEDSMLMIKKLEKFDRALYGGYCGPFFDYTHFVFHVILRSFWIKPNGDRWCLFAGGGITYKSDPEEEWTETENKAESVIKLCKFCHKK